MQTWFHAINILEITGVNEFIRTHPQYYVLPTNIVTVTLQDYFDKYQDNHIKFGSMITNKAFGVIFKDHNGIILFNNKYQLRADDIICPVNIEIHDREELQTLPDHFILNKRCEIRKYNKKYLVYLLGVNNLLTLKDKM